MAVKPALVSKSCIWFAIVAAFAVGVLLIWWDCRLGNAGGFSWRGIIGLLLCVAAPAWAVNLPDDA